MNIVYTILLGYLIGSISPAALVSKLKKTDLRKEGTGNVGASNVTLVIGKTAGVLVMLFDVAKGFGVYMLTQYLFPELRLAGLIGGLSAIIGHVFPFYLGFRGGKGLATFGGMVLAHDPIIFVILLIQGLVLMFIVNYSAAMPMSAGILYPIMAGLKYRDLAVFLITLAASLLIIIKHASNVTKGRQGKDVPIRAFAKSFFSKKNK